MTTVVYGEDAALAAIMEGRNVFITGPGGSGKSRIVSSLREMFQDTTLFAAPTGVAALNIKGMTLHRSFGLSMGVTTPDDYKARSKEQAMLLSSKALDSILVDEGPMVRLDKFIEMDMKLRYYQKNSKPFGGMQLLIFGDGFQMKPILTRNEEAKYKERYQQETIFESELWNTMDFVCAYLPKVHRQKNPEFSKRLNNIRIGRDVQEAVDWMNKNCYGKAALGDAVTLTTTNKAADIINKREFDKIQSPVVKSKAIVDGDFPERPVPEELELKVGLKVMILVNDLEFSPSRYVNGSVGIIKRISGVEVVVDIDGCEVGIPYNKWKNVTQVPQESWAYEDQEETQPDGSVVMKKKRVKKTILVDTEIGSYTQFPLRLGYAITGHKSQGLTLDAVNVDMGYGAFTSGQTYVMLSRATDDQTLRLVKKLRVKDVMVDQQILNFYAKTFPEVFNPGGKYYGV